MLLNPNHDKVCCLKVQIKPNKETTHSHTHSAPAESENVFTTTPNCLMSPHSSPCENSLLALAGPNPLSFTHRNNIPECRSADSILSAGHEWRTGTSELTFQSPLYRSA